MKKLLLAAVAALLAPILSTHAGFTTNQSATSVLGQTDFTSSTGNVTASTLDNAVGLVMSLKTGKLFVADSNNNRILRFSAANAYVTGAAAEAVFGQPDFVSGTANRGGNPAANTLWNPTSLYLDAADRLWVSDSNNRRVLRFDNASTKATGAPADGVLGQPDFATNTIPTGPDRTSFKWVLGLTGDSAGRIWVGDDWDRVLRFDAAATKASGAQADGVLGQPDFTSTSKATSRSGMNFPYAVRADAAGRLWVMDVRNQRVLRFDNAAAKANGADADALLGQANFTTGGAGTSASQFLNPNDIHLSADGTLWVSESGNYRVIGFAAAATKPNGASADIVLGQGNFTSNNPATTATGFGNPGQIFTAGTSTMFVADFGNNRILRFGPVFNVNPPTLTTAATATARKGTVTLKGTSTNAIRITYRVGTTGAFKSATGPAANWTIKLTKLAAGKTHRVTIVATSGSGTTTQAIVTVKSL